MNYIRSITYSVAVSLEALEKHLTNQLRDVLCENLHVDSLKQAYIKVDLLNGGIVFYNCVYEV